MMMKPLQIGNLCIDRPVILAPMAGVTDLPFRLLCKEMDCGLLYTEMVERSQMRVDDETHFF